MEIIIEYVVLDNFCIDSLLLYASLKVLKQPVKKWGVIIAGVIGAGFALVSPLIKLAGLLGGVLKLTIAYVMCVMVYFSFKKAFQRFTLFTLFTFCFGGALTGIFSFLNIPTVSGISNYYLSNLPMGAIITCCVVFVLVIIKIISKVCLGLKSTIINFNICIYGKSKALRGFVDSGNLLHSSNGRPVVIIEEELLSNWLNNDERMALLVGEYAQLNLNNVEKISVSSLGKSYNMTIFDATAWICGSEKQVSLGISYKKIKAINCDAIIGGELLNV